MIAASYILLRFCHFSSLLLVTGCLSYLLFLTPAHYVGRLAQLLKTALYRGTLLAMLSAAGMFAVQTMLMSGEPSGILKPGIWLAVACTRLGLAWLPEMAFSLLSLWLVRQSSRRGRQLLLLSSIIQLLLTAMTGHAAMHDGLRGLAGELSQSIHLLAAAFWCGGLYPLWLLMKQSTGQPADKDAVLTMMNFSRYGHWAVALALLSGMSNTLLIAGLPWQQSPWLLWLYLKVLMVGIMVTLALVNCYCLVPQFKHSADSTRMFIRLTQLELLLALAVIAVVSLFATLSPV